jgi:hypothetical protein
MSDLNFTHRGLEFRSSEARHSGNSDVPILLNARADGRFGAWTNVSEFDVDARGDTPQAAIDKLLDLAIETAEKEIRDLTSQLETLKRIRATP